MTSAAQAASTDSSVYVRGYPVETPAKTYHMFQTDFDLYKGAYELSNGETMVLRQAGRRLVAEVGNRPPKELVALSRNVFVATDKDLKMTLRHDFDGEVRGEVLIRVPAMALGQASGAGGGYYMRLTSR